MSHTHSAHRISYRNTTVKRISIALFMTIAVGATTALADTAADRHDRRITERHGLVTDMAYVNRGVCRPATGIQILGGFASPNDWLDSATDEVCHR